MRTAGRKSNKPKGGKKGKKDEAAEEVKAEDAEVKAEDTAETDKIEHAVEDGVAPLPEGKDAEGQAYSPPVDPARVEELAEQEEKSKPKERAAGRSKKPKDVEAGGAAAHEADDEAPKVKKQRRSP